MHILFIFLLVINILEVNLVIVSYLQSKEYAFYLSYSYFYNLNFILFNISYITLLVLCFNLKEYGYY